MPVPPGGDCNGIIYVFIVETFGDPFPLKRKVPLVCAYAKELEQIKSILPTLKLELSAFTYMSAGDKLANPGIGQELISKYLVVDGREENQVDNPVLLATDIVNKFVGNADDMPVSKLSAKYNSVIPYGNIAGLAEIELLDAFKNDIVLGSVGKYVKLLLVHSSSLQVDGIAGSSVKKLSSH